MPRGTVFLNADDMARTLAASNAPVPALAAGRVLHQRMGEMERERQSFALETNLATHSLAGRIGRWQSLGYQVALLFVWLPSADMAVQRVASRVRAGGHSVPEGTIRRRYQAGLRLFRGTYQALADTWRVYDNSGAGGIALVAQGRVYDRPVWQQISQEDNYDQTIAI